MDKETLQQNRVDMIKSNLSVDNGVISMAQTAPAPKVYDQPREFYVAQIDAIQAQADAYAAARQAEIDECSAVISLMDDQAVSLNPQ